MLCTYSMKRNVSWLSEHGGHKTRRCVKTSRSVQVQSCSGAERLSAEGRGLAKRIPSSALWRLQLCVSAQLTESLSICIDILYCLYWHFLSCDNLIQSFISVPAYLPWLHGILKWSMKFNDDEDDDNITYCISSK